MGPLPYDACVSDKRAQCRPALPHMRASHISMHVPIALIIMRATHPLPSEPSESEMSTVVRSRFSIFTHSSMRRLTATACTHASQWHAAEGTL